MLPGNPIQVKDSTSLNILHQQLIDFYGNSHNLNHREKLWLKWEYPTDAEGCEVLDQVIIFSRPYLSVNLFR